MVELNGKSVDDLMDILDGCDEDTPWEDIKRIMDRLEELDPQAALPADEALACLKEKHPTIFPDIQKGRRQPLHTARLFVAVAAVLAVLALMASAVFPNLFDMFIDRDAFIVSGRLELEEPLGEDMYISLKQALLAQKLPNIAPNWIPERFSVSWVKVEGFEAFTNCSAWYLDAEDQGKGIYVRVTSYTDPGSIQEKFEAEDGAGRSYSSHGTEYYITENHGNPRAMWTVSNCICSIFGDVTQEELHKILDSIGEEVE